MVKFKILHKSGNSRLGRLETAHGVVDTPNFIPVGTQAAVKALGPRELREIGAQIVLANTYHLMLRPGESLIESFGGLHQFMGWDGPIMTDSGGFQVFSLGAALEFGDSKVLGKVQSSKFKVQSEGRKPRLNQLTEEGVVFQSHLDGSKHILTPEKSIEIQGKLGADLIVAFDDHESSKHSKVQMLESIKLTETWELRSLKTFKNDKDQLMYGVVHGGTYKELRVRSARFTDEHFNAIAIGGIYGDKKKLCQILDWTVPEVSEEKPKHLLGIGEVEDIFNGTQRGMDLFDCVAPTRRARFGSLYINPGSGGKSSNSFTLNIRQSKFRTDKNPIDPLCKCSTCQNFSRAYLRHLYMAGEILYHQLAVYHNVWFIIKLMEGIRETISNGAFINFKNSFLDH